jgi:hypothetical protein
MQLINKLILLSIGCIGVFSSMVASAGICASLVQPTQAQVVRLGHDLNSSDIKMTLKVPGLEPQTKYRISGAGTAMDPANFYHLESIEALSDEHGTLDIGSAIVSKLLRRSLTAEEKQLTGALAWKLLKIVKKQAASVDAALTIKSLPEDRSSTSLVLQVVNEKTQEVIYYRQDFTPPHFEKPIALDPVKDKLDGLVYKSAKAGKSPTIIVFAGSTGTIATAWAEWLASQGYNVLALRYFSYDPHDPSVAAGAITYLIDRTPIEIVDRAVAYARNIESVDSQNIWVLGESRGSELALAAAQYHGNELGLRGVIASRPQSFYVGSTINGMYWPGGTEHSSWIVDGNEVPYAPFKAGPYRDQWASAYAIAKSQNETLPTRVSPNGLSIPIIRLQPGFQSFFPAPRESRVDLKGYKGSVVLIGAGDDGLWYSKRGVNEMKSKHFGQPGDDQFVVAGAGHALFVGGRPEILGSDFSVLFSSVPNDKISQTDVDAARSLYVYNGGDQVANAFYAVLTQLAVTRAVEQTLEQDSRKGQLPFPEFIR